MVLKINQKKQSALPGSTKPQDFGAAPGYQTTNLPKEQSINSVETAQQLLQKSQKKETLTS